MNSYIRREQFTIALIVTGLLGIISISAQEEKSPSSVYGPQLKTSATPCEKRGQMDILSDTKGVDFGPYLRNVVQTIRKNWYELIPEAARVPRLKEGTVAIQFAIKKDGSVTQIKYHVSSGDLALDRAAWASVSNSNKLPALPSEFSGNEIALRFYFQYNPQLKVYPAGPFTLTAGSSQQFSTRASGAADTSAHWSLSGKGCDKSDCGKISADGMYIAPAVTKPISLEVNATQEAAPFESACTIVNVNPQIN